MFFKIISLVILQAIFCFTLSYSDNILIETTCQKTPFPDLCKSNLRNNPRSSTADVAGLAHIMADSINAKAMVTLNQIGELIKSSARDPSLKKALTGCLISYNTIIKADIPVAIEAITKGNPKFAVASATDAANEAQRCGQNVANSPISGDNKAIHELFLVLKSIASMKL